MKKIEIIIMSFLSLFLVTGCFKRDTMEGISIYTTVYPIEYLVESIYGYNSTVDSIYPNGTDISTYELTNKQQEEYAQTDMFIYNGLTDEKQLAATFLNKNKDLKIIDVSKGVSLQYDPEELWLCPSNYLMLAQNIKNELNEYINSTVVRQEIESNYDALKLTISTFDAELKLIAENSTNKTIIAGNDVFNFLEKYGFEVLSVEENDKYVQTDYQTARNNINNDTNSFVFVLDTDPESENVKKLEEAGATVVYVDSMINLADEERNDGLDYPKMMESFIEQIRTEAYN